MNCNNMRGLKLLIIISAVLGVFLSCNKQKENVNDEVLSFYIGDEKIDNDVATIICGITTYGTTVKMNYIPLLFNFKHESNTEMFPYVFTVLVCYKNPIHFSRYYQIHSEGEYEFDSKTKRNYCNLALCKYRLNPYETIPFPITEFEIGDYDNEKMISFSYGNKELGGKEKLLEIYPFSLNYNGEKHTKEQAECYFINYCRDFLRDDPSGHVALVFDSTIIPRLDANILFTEKGLKANKLKDLIDL